MKVKLISPRMTAGQARGRREVRYALFPPLGLATLAGYLRDDDEVTLVDENVERLGLTDAPDLVAIQTNVSSAKRAYAIADEYRRRGIPVALGGLHATALPEEAGQHADAVLLGPGEDTWPQFLADFRAGRPAGRYQSAVRTLADVPSVRRDLIKRDRYVAANSLVMSRGCPHGCDFCSNSTFFRGGRSYYTQTVSQTLAEIARLPGRHLYFLDDHFFGNRQLALEMIAALRGRGKVWQAAGTVETALDRDLMRQAAAAGMRSYLVGFETLGAENLRAHKRHNLGHDYDVAVRNLHEAGILINATFIFGMDRDDADVFDRTVEWAIGQGVETATFHVLTPYPGTRVYDLMAEQGRILSTDWDRYDTKHVVFRPARMTAEQLQEGYDRAYRDFYTWGSILRSARTKAALREQLRHAAYAAGWGKFQGIWDLLIRTGQVSRAVPVLLSVLEMAATEPQPNTDEHGWGRASGPEAAVEGRPR